MSQAIPRIEREFDEPAVDVVRDYAEQMKYSCPSVAEALEVTEESLRSYCRRRGIRFSQSPMGRRGQSPGRPPRLIRENGIERSLTDWAQELGIRPNTALKRLRTHGRLML